MFCNVVAYHVTCVPITVCALTTDKNSLVVISYTDGHFLVLNCAVLTTYGHSFV